MSVIDKINIDKISSDLVQYLKVLWVLLYVMFNVYITWW